MTATTDLIVQWSEVREGDLVLLDDCLVVAERVHVAEDDWQGTKWLRVDISHREPDGRVFSTDRHGDRYTAVRRAN